MSALLTLLHSLCSRRYTPEEVEQLKIGASRMSLFDEGDGKELKMSSGSKGKVKWKPGDSHAVGFATTTVRASAEQAMAFIWDTEARAKARHDDLEKAVDERPSEHNMLVYNRKKTPNAVDNRDFLGRTLWRKTGSGFEIVSTPESSERRGTPRKTVRGKLTSTMRIVRVQENVTKLEFVIQPDFGGELPAWFMNRSLGGQLARVTEARDYFQALRHEYDAEDGVAIGNLLLSETREEKHHEKGETRVEARVRALFVKNKGLKELGEKHRSLPALLAKMAANKLRPGGDSKVKLCNMTEKDANVIGGALASCIAANLTSQAAVDEWILRYPAMGELEREYVRERSERKKELQQAVAARQRLLPCNTPRTARSKRAERAGDRANKRRQ
jgi:hypothetical protein